MYKDFHFQNKICVLFSMPFISLFNHLTRRDGLVKKWIFYFFNALRKCFHYLIKFHLYIFRYLIFSLKHYLQNKKKKKS